MRLQTFIPLLLLVLIAGCVQDKAPVTQGKTPEGITVLKFAPEKDTLKEKESTNLVLRIQNTGDAQASGITAKITRAGDLTSKQITTTIEDLDPPDESFNQPGGTKEILWTITAPETDVPKAQDLAARVEFNYRSQATKEILALSSARARELEQAGKAPQPGVETNSFAPVRLRIISKDPMELGEGEAKEGFTFKVYLTNEGGGAVETAKTSPTKTCATEKLDCIDSVEITSSTKEKIKCEGVTADASETFKVPDVKLWGGKEATVTCTMTTDLGEAREKQIVIKATAIYRYHYDSRTGVKLEPKK